MYWGGSTEPRVASPPLPLPGPPAEGAFLAPPNAPPPPLVYQTVNRCLMPYSYDKSRACFAQLTLGCELCKYCGEYSVPVCLWVR